MIYIIFTRYPYSKSIFFLSHPSCFSKERIQFFSDKTNRDSCHFINCPGFKNNLIFHICQNVIPARREPRLYNAKNTAPVALMSTKAVPSVRDQGCGRPVDDSAAGRSTDRFTRSGGSWFEPTEASRRPAGEIEPVGFEPRSYKIKSPSHWFYVQ